MNTRMLFPRTLDTLALLAAGVMLLSIPTGRAASTRHPNFIVILGEGAGWTSTSVQMDDRNSASKGAGLKTPNLERLAAGGMRFSDGYAPSPRCTPSRAALFTGRSPAALHMTFVGDGKGRGSDEAKTRLIPPHALLELPEAETTIGDLLKRAGYATAHFGKWHLGRANPSRHGFDESDGPTSNGGPENVANPNPKQAIAMTARGIDFMERQTRADRPFYLQLSHYPSQEEKGGGGGRNREVDNQREEMNTVDRTIGQVLDAVERLGLAGDTYVLYTTDHGTPGRNPPLAGGKGTVWEGGLRVPFIVAGPGIKAGTCSHVRVSATDLFPTFAELAGVTEPLPKGLEGGSFAPVLFNGGIGTVKRPREEFVVHFPHYDKDRIGPASAIILGDFKLIRAYESGTFHLFDLSRDIGERNDLAKQRPEKVTDLGQRLADYLKVVDAQMPALNPNSDPSQAADTLPGEKRNGGGTRGGGRKGGKQAR
jgi:arylsulfatase A-like enzyme